MGIKLIVGLGNPGAEYEQTRHNAGAWFVEELAQQTQVSMRRETKFQGLYAIARPDNQDCHLLIPTTYMNHSGAAVSAVANFYKIPASSILIAHDELDVPVGDIRLKYDGGHGGHNGLRDIIKHLGTPQFYRLRIGVGRPTGAEVIDYVLNPPRRAEREEIDRALVRAFDVLPLLLKGEFQRAMHQLHTVL